MTRFLVRYKTIAVGLVLLIISTIMMSSKINAEYIGMRTYFFNFIFFIEQGFLNGSQSIKNVFTDAQTIEELEKELVYANEQVQYYKERSRLYNFLQQENNQLRDALDIQSKMNYSAYYSKVIFKDPSLLSDFLIINKGYNQGIRINMPVVRTIELNNRLVLIGKTVEVGGDFSRVRVITAKNSYLSVKSQNNEYSGILRGQGAWNQNLAIDYVPVEVKPNIGEIILSAGGSDIYPEGLYIGEVQGIGQNVMEEFFQVLYINSAFDYNNISDVFVLDYVNDTPNFNELEMINER